MNTITNVGLLAVGTGTIAKGVDLVSTNLWGGIATIVAGIIIIVIYEKTPASTTAPAA